MVLSSIGFPATANSSFSGQVSPPSAPKTASGPAVSELASASPSGVNRTLEVNGKVVAVVFNSGAVAIEDEYAALVDKLNWGGLDETGVIGPNLAEQRSNQLMGLISSIKSGNETGFSKDLLEKVKAAQFEMVVSETAMKQAEFLNFMRKPTDDYAHLVDRTV